jgi:hypothetical protein
VNSATKHKTPHSGNPARTPPSIFSKALAKNKQTNLEAEMHKSGDCNQSKTKLKALTGGKDLWNEVNQ